jgi:hypothetical protein
MTTARLQARCSHQSYRVIAILKQAEAGSPVPGLCRQHGISNVTLNTLVLLHATGADEMLACIRQ